MAVHVTIVVPSGNLDGALFVIETTLTASVAVACPIETVVRGPVASIFMSGGAVICGRVFSFGSVINDEFVL